MSTPKTQLKVGDKVVATGPHSDIKGEVVAIMTKPDHSGGTIVILDDEETTWIRHPDGTIGVNMPGAVAFKKVPKTETLYCFVWKSSSSDGELLLGYRKTAAELDAAIGLIKSSRREVVETFEHTVVVEE